MFSAIQGSDPMYPLDPLFWNLQVGLIACHFAGICGGSLASSYPSTSGATKEQAAATLT
jgi:hypothetical protein